jgi:hypothetical protein
MLLRAAYFGAGGAGIGFDSPLFGWQHEGAPQQLTGSQQDRRQQRFARQQTGSQHLPHGSQHFVTHGSQAFTQVLQPVLQQVVAQPQGSQQRCRQPAEAESTASSHTAVSTTRDITIRRIVETPRI